MYTSKIFFHFKYTYITTLLKIFISIKFYKSYKLYNFGHGLDTKVKPRFIWKLYKNIIYYIRESDFYLSLDYNQSTND